MKTALIRLFLWGVIIPLWIVYSIVAAPPAYTHYRSVLLANIHRLYEKEQAKRVYVAMIDLGNQKIPAMPKHEMELPR